jgi:hypothetical protein
VVRTEAGQNGERQNGEIFFFFTILSFSLYLEKTFRHFGRHKIHKMQAIFYGHVNP